MTKNVLSKKRERESALSNHRDFSRSHKRNTASQVNAACQLHKGTRGPSPATFANNPTTISPEYKTLLYAAGTLRYEKRYSNKMSNLLLLIMLLLLCTSNGWNGNRQIWCHLRFKGSARVACRPVVVDKPLVVRVGCRIVPFGPPNRFPQ